MRTAWVLQNKENGWFVDDSFTNVDDSLGKTHLFRTRAAVRDERREGETVRKVTLDITLIEGTIP